MSTRLVFTCAAAFVSLLGAHSAMAGNDWSGKGQAGVLVSQGNTEAKSANAAVDVAREVGAWKHALHFGALYGQSGEITSAQRWDLGWQTNRDFSAKMFAFGALRYSNDKFSGFQYQATGSAGVGYKFIDSATTKLTGQVGAGYRQLRPEVIVKDAAGAVISRTPLDKVGEAVATAGLDYSQALTSTTSITNKLLIESGSSNTLTTDTFALAVKMSDRLALSVGLSVQNNSSPPAGLKQTDTVETINVVFAL